MPENAHAGPPFRTDDPVPVELGHYEFYSFSTGTHLKGDTSGELPGFELTYGLIPNGQLQIGAGTAFAAPSNGGTVFGYGDTEVSFKYRFIQEDKDGLRPQVAIFPAVQIPTGNHDRGLGAIIRRAKMRAAFQYFSWNSDERLSRDRSSSPGSAHADFLECSRLSPSLRACFGATNPSSIPRHCRSCREDHSR